MNAIALKRRVRRPPDPDELTRTLIMVFAIAIQVFRIVKLVSSDPLVNQLSGILIIGSVIFVVYGLVVVRPNVPPRITKRWLWFWWAIAILQIAIIPSELYFNWILDAFNSSHAHQ